MPREIRPLQVRSVEERTVEGIIVPYGETIAVRGRPERWVPGAVAGIEVEDVRLMYEHGEVIGRALEVREDQDGAVGVFRVARTSRGDDVLELAAEGLLGLSAGFRPLQTRPAQDGAEEILSAEIREVSAVAFPAYAGAKITAVRHEEDRTTQTVQEDVPMSETTQQTTEPVETRDSSAIIEEAVAAAVEEVRSLVVRDTPAPAQTTREPWGNLMVRALREVASPDTQWRTRALADVVGTSNSGLLPQDYRAEVIGYLDARRPLFAHAGTVPFPTQGYHLTFPRITQHTQVTKRTAEKAEAASRALTVDPESFGMEWFAGAVDVALELIWQSDPSVLGVLVDDMMDEYALATETEFATDAEAAATATGSALDTSTWAAFSAEIQTVSQAIRQATGQPGNLVGLNSTDWGAFIGLTLPQAPASLATPGLAPDLTAEEITLAGVTFFHSPYSTASIQTNAKALRKSERAPTQVSADNVALMGRDVGVIGATICLPMYAGGIYKFSA